MKDQSPLSRSPTPGGPWVNICLEKAENADGNSDANSWTQRSKLNLLPWMVGTNIVLTLGVLGELLK